MHLNNKANSWYNLILHTSERECVQGPLDRGCSAEMLREQTVANHSKIVPELNDSGWNNQIISHRTMIFALHALDEFAIGPNCSDVLLFIKLIRLCGVFLYILFWRLIGVWKKWLNLKPLDTQYICQYPKTKMPSDPHLISSFHKSCEIVYNPLIQKHVGITNIISVFIPFDVVYVVGAKNGFA